MDDLASVWCEWAEMELRHKNFKRALDLMRRATYTPDKYNRREVGPATCFTSSCYLFSFVLLCWPGLMRRAHAPHAPAPAAPTSTTAARWATHAHCFCFSSSCCGPYQDEPASCNTHALGHNGSGTFVLAEVLQQM